MKVRAGQPLPWDETVTADHDYDADYEGMPVFTLRVWLPERFDAKQRADRELVDELLRRIR